MYEEYWGLTEPAFGLTPDPRFLYRSKGHEDVLTMLHHAVTRNKGAAVLWGDIGLGKTTISRTLIQMLSPETYRVVLIVNPILTPTQMIQEILTQLDVQTTIKNRQALIQLLHETLLQQFTEGKRIILMIDEAHLIRATTTLEELRLLLNCQLNDQFLISLVLMGQKELQPKIAKAPALESRLAIKCALYPLNVVETGEMVLHRLRVAGYDDEHSPFTPDAIFQLHKASNGYPRIISTLADQALIMGMADGVERIDGFMMHDACRQHIGVAA